MSIPCKLERSLLSHEEYETVGVTHHPAIHEIDRDGLHQVKDRLRRCATRSGRGRGRRGARYAERQNRAGKLSRTAERPLRRKQVFAGALQRINKEIGRIRRLEARAALTEAARRALALRRAGRGCTILHPIKTHITACALPGARTGAPRSLQSKVGSVSQATKTAQAVRDSKT